MTGSLNQTMSDQEYGELRVAEAQSSAVEEAEASSSVVSVALSVVAEASGMPPQLLIQEIADLLKFCPNVIRVGSMVEAIQAPYEELVVDCRFSAEVKAGGKPEALQILGSRGPYGSGGWRLVGLERGLFPTGLRAAHSNVNVESLSFGSFLGPSTFLQHWRHSAEIGANRRYSVYVDFEHFKRTVTIYLGAGSFRLQIGYQSIHEIRVDLESPPNLPSLRPESQTLFLLLRHPPQLWRRLQPRNGGRPTFRDWVRVASMPQLGCLQETLGATWSVALSIPRSEAKQYEGIADATRDQSPLFDILARIRLRSRLNPAFLKVTQLEASSVFEKEPIKLPELPHFPSSYALQALVSRGYIVTDQLKRMKGQSEPPLFGRLVAASCHKNPSATQRALEQLIGAIDERRWVNILKAFDFLFRMQEEGSEGSAESVLIPPGCCMVPKVVVTPTRCLLLPPQVMLFNRVVRAFGEEFALRLNFRDDDGRKVQNNMLGMREEGRDIMIRMVRKALLEGVELGGRRFKFLAWSNSQLRDHGCYLYADQEKADPDGTPRIVGVAEIRHWMGDFTAINSVPKLMSRMGQCFSQAQIGDREVDDATWTIEADIVGGELHPETLEHYTFSDGIGRISLTYANRIAENLKLDYLPCAFQIRFKGCKGMLVIDPWMKDVNEVGEKLDVVYRQSMAKFSSDGSSALEVVKYAMPSPVCFNRQLIMILDQVSQKQGSRCWARVVGRIQRVLEQELLAMADMLLVEADAARALSDRLNLSIDFRQLASCGLLLSREPFTRRLLLALHRYNIKEKLFKAKIEIHPSLGRSLYGVLDETGLLQYGQVFIRVSSYLNSPNKDPRVISGQVLVTKNPCIVPGDVRVFTAVDLEALHFLNDVIVFPRHGPRPHPDEMAGSDLDGDEYSVFWDPLLLLRANEEAMTFPKAQAPLVPDGAGPNEMVNFFLTYTTQDVIGKISNAHLAAADRIGIFSDICMEIGRKCSTAVDFPKTGMPADELTREEKTFKYPDYFAKDHSPCYRSPWLLGQIYRKIKSVEEMLELGGYEVAAAVDEDLIHPSLFLAANRPVREAARRRLEVYAAQVQSLLDNYGIADEASLVSGQMLTLRNRVAEMDKDDFTFYNTEKLVELRYARLATATRRAFWAEFGGEPESVMEGGSTEAAVVKASAWYEAAYGASARGDARLACLSFPWVVWELLALRKRAVSMARGAADTAALHFHSRLVEAINAYCEINRDRLIEVITELEMSNPVIKAYMCHYEFLAALVFVVFTWAERGGLFARSSVRGDHLALLLIQVGLGQRRREPNEAKAARTAESAAEEAEEALELLEPVPSLQAARDMNEADGRDGAAGLPLQAQHGRLLLQFLAYLSTESFRQAAVVDFEGLGLPNQLMSGEWAPLHELAFKAYNRMSLSGSWEVLLPSGDAGRAESDWDFDESEPLAVELVPPCEGGLSDAEAAALLCEWSGCEEVVITREQRSLETARILCSGSLRARQGLRAIATSARLQAALVQGLPPQEPPLY